MKKRPEGYYAEKYQTMELLPEWFDRVKRAAETIMAGFAKYHDVSVVTGIPWQVVGVIHMMESGCNWRTCLHNGQPWNRRTTMVPVGKGPFTSWEAAAIDALRKRGTPKTTEEIGAFFERYNGMGYCARGKNSPYLWSGSNHGVGMGKFTYDHGYDPKAVSKQAGAMVLLRALGWPV
jgi:lysozyme family protein